MWWGIGIATAVLAFVLWKKEPSVVERLKVQTMAIHDEAMVEMAEMNRLGRVLKRQLQQLDPDTPRADSLRAILLHMKKAEEDMYSWMRHYVDPIDSSTEAALRYLEDQKQRISQNQQDIRAARDAARRLLGQ